ncbi:MAG: hypothetical protein E6662_16880, partial [Pantoea sp.]|nr:hypothetical protein [Pantoea sp.]
AECVVNILRAIADYLAAHNGDAPLSCVVNHKNAVNYAAIFARCSGGMLQFDPVQLMVKSSFQ